jgi:hypothetical protein
MSETPLYDLLIRKQKLISKIMGNNTKRDKEIFFSYVEKLKEKYPSCRINFNLKQRNNKTLKSRPFENSSKMYYAIFKATEQRCSQAGGRSTRKRKRE